MNGCVVRERESTLCHSTGHFCFLIAGDRAKQCFSFKGLIAFGMWLCEGAKGSYEEVRQMLDSWEDSNACRVPCVRYQLQPCRGTGENRELSNERWHGGRGQQDAEAQKDRELTHTKARGSKLSFSFEDLLWYHCQDHAKVSRWFYSWVIIRVFQRKTLQRRHLRCSALRVRSQCRIWIQNSTW